MSKVYSMRIYFILIVLLFSTFISYGQSEFINKNGGVSIGYGQGNSKEYAVSRSVSMAFQFKSGLYIGFGTQNLNDEVKPLIHGGIVTKTKDKAHYARTIASFIYSKHKDIYIVGGSIGLAYILNAQKVAPTSVSSSFGIISAANNETGASEIGPTFACGITQALGVKQNFFPHIGLGFGYDVKNNIPQLIFQVGVNFNFKPLGS